MIIKSQNNESLINSNAVAEYFLRDDTRICVSLLNGGVACLGSYATKERALDVLDDIFLTYKNEAFVNTTVYRMPKD